MKSSQAKNSQTEQRSDKCVNLRRVQEERYEQLLRSAKGLVDLTEVGEEYQRQLEREQKQARATALANARNLIDLTRRRQPLSSKRKLSGVKKKTSLKITAARKSQPTSREKDKAKPPEIIFPDRPVTAKPKIKPVLPSKPKTESKSAAKTAPKDILVKPLVDDVADIFPEYFETESRPVAPPQPKAAVSKQPELIKRIDFLQPSIELAGEHLPRTPVQPVKSAVVTASVDRAKTKTRGFRKKSFVIFVILALFLVGGVGASAAVQRTLDSQDEIMSKATAGAASLQSAAAYLKQQNFLQAVTDFERAADFFAEAEADINEIGDITSQLVQVVPQGRAAVALVRAGQAMSESGQSFARAVGYFRQVGGIFADIEFSQTEKNLSIAEALQLSQAEFEQVALSLEEAQSSLDRVNPDSLPAEFQDEFTEAQDVLAVLSGVTDYFGEFSEQMAAITGAYGPQRYLVLFANSDEIRGSAGGFPGSYMIVDFDDGKIKSLDFKDIYEVRGQQTEMVVPPVQFQLITSNFELQDVSGWPIDYRDSAAKVMEYYELSRAGTTVDGVWTINSDIIPDLLAITGPIKLPEYSLTVTEDNYLEVLESEVESDEARQTGQPKKIVETLIDKILTKIFSQKNVDWLALLGTVNKAISEKKLLMYFTDPELEEFALSNSAAGAIKEADDYLAVFSYNIGGGKTDKDVSEDIQHAASISPQGDLSGNVKITRQHRSKDDLDHLSKVKNVSWVKVVLPAQAENIKVKGEDANYPIEHPPAPEAREDEALAEVESSATELNNGRVLVTKEAGKKVVGFWMGLEPGASRTVEISYDIPEVIDLEGFFNEAAGFTSVFQPQPGKSNLSFSSHVTFPESVNIAWQDASNAFVNNLGESLSWTVDNPAGDIVVSAVVDREGLR